MLENPIAILAALTCKALRNSGGVCFEVVSSIEDSSYSGQTAQTMKHDRSVEKL
jgi:hypothetical protein